MLYHFMLPHNASSMTVRMRMCRFPEVRYASDKKITKRTARTQSTSRMNLGFKEEPGLSRSERNDPSADDSVVDI